MPTVTFADASAASVPIVGVTRDSLADYVAGLDPAARGWITATGFEGRAGDVCLVPDRDGSLQSVLFGQSESDPLSPGQLATRLPDGTYRLDAGFSDPELAALAIALGGYRFARYRSAKDGEIRLVLPAGVDEAGLRSAVAATSLARDLVNTPANRMGPADLAEAARELADRHDASFGEIIGDDLLKQNLPMIHTVGAAAATGREPRLIDFAWGDPDAPKVTLVGKGVCFDTGGLDIKPSSGMLIMKKDMGGAANALGLASMIMDAKLPVRLRVLIPAVENAISGAAFRPGDILESRKGLSVEIGNTDAEGRLVLADALTLASEESPALLFDFATLTGAARVALGPELPAVFTRDDGLAAEIASAADAVADPLWRLPLWSPYLKMIDSPVADINNAGAGGFAGAITAALFLSRFVGDDVSWLHADIYAWNPKSRPAHPEGGEAQTIRAIFAMLKRRFGG